MTKSRAYQAILDQVTIRFPDHERSGDSLVVRVDNRHVVVSPSETLDRIVVWAELAPVDVHYARAAAVGAQVHVAAAYHERGFSIGFSADEKAIAIGRSIDGFGADIHLVADTIRALAREIPVAQQMIDERIQAQKEFEAQAARAEQNNSLFVRA